jgi:putative DNA primase/helicase
MISETSTAANGSSLLTKLAHTKCLQEKFLREDLGLHDLAGGRAVGIPYFGMTGEELGVTRRLALKAGDGTRRPQGFRLAAYGLWRLDRAHKEGLLFLVEGESDCWALWQHGIPALGIPGASSAKVLTAEHLSCIRRIYVVREPDKGGETFLAGVADRLKSLGFEGRAFEVRMPEGIKDPADLHAAHPERFKTRLEEAIIASNELDLSKPQETTESAEWSTPQPIPNDLPDVMAFDPSLLPEAFGTFVTDVAERMQCPLDFPAVAIMVALAGIVGKKIGIRPKRQDDWLVVPNIWGAVIGRPGIMKTPAIRQPFKFLQRLEIKAKEEFAKEMEDYELKKMVAEEQKRLRKEAVARAIKAKRDPEEAAQEIKIEKPNEPVLKRYLVNDSTVEKLGELLNQDSTGLTVFRDELIGLFWQLDKEGQEGARAFYLEAWDGLGKFTYDRINRGSIFIECVTLVLMGAITPGRLVDYLAGALKGGKGDDGLLQRFQLAVYPNINGKWRNIDRWPDTEAKQKAFAVFEAMDKLDPKALGAEEDDNDDDVPFLRFSSEAQAVFDAWRAKLEEKVRSGDEHPAFESHLAKYRSLVPSLALLIHLAEGAQGPVGEGPILKAIQWAAYLESHARRIYSIATDTAAISAKALAKRIEKGALRDGFTLREIYRKHWTGLSDKEAVDQAIDLLLELGWLKELVEQTGGKPKINYRINPALLPKTAPDPSDKSAKSPADPPFGTNGTDLPGDSDVDWGDL